MVLTAGAGDAKRTAAAAAEEVAVAIVDGTLDEVAGDADEDDSP